MYLYVQGRIHICVMYVQHIYLYIVQYDDLALSLNVNSIIMNQN